MARPTPTRSGASTIGTSRRTQMRFPLRFKQSAPALPATALAIRVKQWVMAQRLASRWLWWRVTHTAYRSFCMTAVRTKTRLRAASCSSRALDCVVHGLAPIILASVGFRATAARERLTAEAADCALLGGTSAQTAGSYRGQSAAAVGSHGSATGLGRLMDRFHKNAVQFEQSPTTALKIAVL